MTTNLASDQRIWMESVKMYWESRVLTRLALTPIELR